VLVLAAGFGLATGLQQAARTPSQQDKIEVLNVRLPISVLDKDKNRFVKGLTLRNFEVYEDGKKQRLESFESPSQLPLRVGILMDTSESVKLKLPTEKEAAEDFVATILARTPRRDKVLFVTFDSQVTLHVDFTDSEEELIRAIRKAKAGGYTRLYDAVYRVVEEKMANPEAVDARRVIVVLSDGEDTGSDRNLRETMNLAQSHDVTIFGVSTKNFTGITRGMVTNEDDKVLRRLCEETGGRLFMPSQKKELFEAFSAVAFDLRSEYVVSYYPDNQKKTGKQREIKVKLIGTDGRTHYKQHYTY
jgi:Ca-activated chloride channel family protein